MADTSAVEMAYPLRWPHEKPRTASRKQALFRDAGRALTMATARKRLAAQLEAMTPRGRGWRVTDVVLSTNIRFTAAGTRDQNVSRREPEDVGAALYFRLDRRPHVLACDRWDTVYDNIAAIAAHIEALRGQERWGVADLKQAFAGHTALPAPEQWWQVLGTMQSASAGEIDRAYRERARSAHPDAGGSDAAMARLNAARDAGKAVADRGGARG